MAKPVRKSATKNPPILSHEFIIQNHADIVSCVAMLFVIGLLIPSTVPIASIFISLQHNVTEAGEIPLYTSGIKDWAAVFFYSLICIVIQAIIQEYVLDKISKKFHLSKSKLAVFNASGQLAFYYGICNIWGMNIIVSEKFLPNIYKREPQSDRYTYYYKKPSIYAAFYNAILVTAFKRFEFLRLQYAMPVLVIAVFVLRLFANFAYTPNNDEAQFYTLRISNIWADYPSPMSFMMKLFLIIQISYALHEIPELYFQRTKKEEYAPKTISALSTLILIAIPYFMNFNRLLICLIVLHYVSEFFVHFTQVVQSLDKDDKFSKLGRFVSLSVMVATRFFSVILSILTLWLGLSAAEQQELDIAAGHFNVPVMRLALLAGISVVQVYFIAVVTRRELQAARESSSSTVVPTKPAKQQKPKSKKVKKVDDSDLPEVDQNTNKNLRSRATNKTK